MHMFTRPVTLMCTGLLSALVNCPGIVCPRERSRRKADTRKNEDGNVTRNFCVNIVACLPEFCFVKYQVHPLYVSNKMSISLLAACVDMSGTFQLASTFQCITNKFLERSRGPFRQPFSKNNCMLTPTTATGAKKKNGVQPEIDRDSCPPQSRQRLPLFSSRCLRKLMLT